MNWPNTATKHNSLAPFHFYKSRSHSATPKLKCCLMRTGQLLCLQVNLRPDSYFAEQRTTPSIPLIETALTSGLTCHYLPSDGMSHVQCCDHSPPGRCRDALLTRQEFWSCVTVLSINRSCMQLKHGTELCVLETCQTPSNGMLLPARVWGSKLWIACITRSYSQS